MILIWYMVSEMVKKRVRQGFILYAIIPAHYSSWSKILVKLKNLNTLACLNLIYGAAKQQPKM